MNAGVCLFHIDSFFFFLPGTPLPQRLATPPPPQKRIPMRSHAQKRTKKHEKLENVSRWRWRRTSYDQVSWKKTSEKNENDETGEEDVDTLSLKSFFFVFAWGRHGDMLGKRWANRHGGWVVLKGGKKTQGRGES